MSRSGLPPGGTHRTSLRRRLFTGTRVTAASRAGMAELSATLYTIRQPNEIQIRLNGRPIHVCLFSGSGFGGTDIEGLPVELHKGLNRLDIQSRMSPLVPASDTRKLAVAVTSLRLASSPGEARAVGELLC